MAQLCYKCTTHALRNSLAYRDFGIAPAPTMYFVASDKRQRVLVDFRSSSIVIGLSNAVPT